MKVAYNNCFGGFGLSPQAETEYRKKKGIDLTWHEPVGEYPYKSFRKVNDFSKMRKQLFSLASTKDLGDEINEVPKEYYFYKSWYGDEGRDDPDLIEVIERLGDAANGHCARLAIKEIPDGAIFEITEYDGNEDVVPPRQSW